MLTQSLLEKAHEASKDHHSSLLTYQRGLYLTWYCALECKFCYMSVSKAQITNPKLAKRTMESVLAEAFLCTKLGWEIEFLASGYRALDTAYVLKLLENIYKITNKKQWLNIGVLSKEELVLCKPYLEGVFGAVETVNPMVHDLVCQSKPLAPILTMYKACDQLQLKKAMTLVIGIGETINDFPLLKNFIQEHQISRMTLYALRPVKGTMFTEPPAKNYYLEWLAMIRTAFPHLELTAGVMGSRLDTLQDAAYLGINGIAKFPAMRNFNSQDSHFIEQQITAANRQLQGSLTELPYIDLEELDALDLDELLKQKIKRKASLYLKLMRKERALPVMSKTI